MSNKFTNTKQVETFAVSKSSFAQFNQKYPHKFMRVNT